MSLTTWFKHILYLTEHEKGFGKAKKLCLAPLHSTYMHLLLVYSDKVSTTGNTILDIN